LTDLRCIFLRKMLAANEAYFVNIERRQGRILCSGDINVCGVPQHLITTEILCKT